MTWTAPPIERTVPPYVADERTSLQAWLRFHRETLLWKCAGLTHEQLAARAVPPSGMSLLGLVRHMTDVERWWFRTNLRAEQVEGPFGPRDNLERRLRRPRRDAGRAGVGGVPRRVRCGGRRG